VKFEINERRFKHKLVGIRLFQEEYDLITSIAKEKRVSRSFVAESLIRAAMKKLDPKLIKKNKPN